MRWMFVLLLASAGAFAPRSAEAVSIALVPSATTVNVGDTLTLTFEASALAGAAVGGFDLDVSFDAALFSLTDVVFGTALGDESLGDQLTDVVTGTGAVSLGSVSLLGATELAALQGDPVTLVTLSFQALGAGTGPFGIEAAELSDAFGAALAIGSQTGASVEVVPEPALLGLLALGGVALARGVRRE
jgi:hypothetical protein